VSDGRTATQPGSDLARLGPQPVGLRACRRPSAPERVVGRALRVRCGMGAGGARGAGAGAGPASCGVRAVRDTGAGYEHSAEEDSSGVGVRTRFRRDHAERTATPERSHT
jgi:hypothetical protein